ncbi:AbfB domain-containing protein [Streptomyces sp. NPDC057686]|uniref:AbfB domain-containing protein n=1 Tax=Streptomyces sp. NPDC057686 TaxID=3346212 RepID=UPI0036C152A1
MTQLCSGALPSGYHPMHQQGAIILGSGGDCCQTDRNASAGTFYEGAMVKGCPSDATDAAVRASTSTVKGAATWIVRAGLADSNCISLESANASGSYLRRYAFQLHLQPADGASQFAADGTFCPESGNSGMGYSLQSFNHPAKYIRHYGHTGCIASNGGRDARDTTSLWSQDTTWLAAAPWS